jgi:hypothetical protein
MGAVVVRVRRPVRLMLRSLLYLALIAVGALSWRGDDMLLWFVGIGSCVMAGWVLGTKE